jgi:hypothetical protein
MASFSELIEKLGRGEPLNPIEMGQLRDEARAVEEAKNVVKGWLTSGSSSPRFQEVRATTGVFSIMPNEAAHFQMDLTASVVVPHYSGGDLTPIVWDFSKNSQFFSLSSIGGSSITCALPGTLRQRVWWVIGCLDWGEVSNGYREVFLSFYDAAGNGIAARPLSKVEGSSFLDTLPFCVPIQPVMGEDDTIGVPSVPYSIKLEVRQTSGIDVSVRNAVLSIAILR